NEGYRLVGEAKDAEVILINSCAFIGEAKQESIDAILEHARLKETGRCKALVVAGCLTQRYADVLQHEMPEVDYFVGTSAYPRIASILKGERDRAVIPDPDYIADSKTPRRNSMPHWTAYVKISEGCDNKCTFCIIPTLRGLQRSRPIADIVVEAHKLVAEGAVELNLVAQDLTAYGHDLPGKPKLHDLLQALRDVPARWIRLHYAYPRDFPDALIDALARQPNVARYLDMPLQHISDPVLRRMKRGRDSVWVRRLVRKVRERVPGLTFRTSFIAGFPGETEEQFQEIDGKVYVNRGQARPGEIVRVEIEQAGDYDLVGGIAGADGSPVAVAAPKVPRPRFPILSH